VTGVGQEDVGSKSSRVAIQKRKIQLQEIARIERGLSQQEEIAHDQLITSNGPRDDAQVPRNITLVAVQIWEMSEDRMNCRQVERPTGSQDKEGRGLQTFGRRTES
jgi:hypothetical protein